MIWAALLLEQVGELVLGYETLARGYRDAGVGGDARHLFDVLRGNRLLEPERMVRLQVVGHPDRAVSGQLAVCADSYFEIVADGVADALEYPGRVLDLP